MTLTGKALERIADPVQSDVEVVPQLQGAAADISACVIMGNTADSSSSVKPAMNANVLTGTKKQLRLLYLFCGDPDRVDSVRNAFALVCELINLLYGDP